MSEDVNIIFYLSMVSQLAFKFFNMAEIFHLSLLLIPFFMSLSILCITLYLYYPVFHCSSLPPCLCRDKR